MSAPKPRATSYSDAEQEFFGAGNESRQTEPVETFSDLDEGYRPQSFWRRLFGRSSRR